MRERLAETQVKSRNDRSKSRKRSSSRQKRINSTVVRLTQPKKRHAPRVRKKSKERLKTENFRERKKAAKQGRKMYPELDSRGKQSYCNVDQWARAYEKAVGVSSRGMKNPEHFYQSKKTGKVKHKMTRSAMLRMQAGEKKRQLALKKKVRIEGEA